MKRLFLFITLVCQLTICVAQQADFQKAVAKYKTAKTISATATKTSHKNAVANDVVTKGTLLMKAPAEVSITMEGGKDQLLMQGSTFTMTVKGKKHTTSSEKNGQFRSFQTVFESILSGGAKDISKLSDLTTTKQGNTLTLTITPQAESKKAARRMMFSSFVLTIDTKSSELKSLRMNERGGYTEYTFSGYQFK
ncbi:MAG: outer membrane lipoprotein carrier protein LolA [Prevotella sp.]|nr:outer membrane lipoprotein carrier protein LolA [Prevotella sp.]